MVTPPPPLNFYAAVGFLANAGAFPSYRNGAAFRSALSELRPVPPLPGRGGQADISSTPRLRQRRHSYITVHTAARQTADVMDGASA